VRGSSPLEGFSSCPVSLFTQRTISNYHSSFTTVMRMA
jgi:hypothetical protein